MNQVELWKQYAYYYEKFTPSFQKELLRFTAENSSGNVLDAGCGIGKLFQYLQYNPNVKTINGIDFSSEMLKYARLKAQNRNLDKVGILGVVDLNQEFISSRNYDTICSLNVLYTLDSPFNFLQNAIRKLNKNGKLILSSQNRQLNLERVLTQMDKEFKGDEYEHFKEVQSTLAGKNKLVSKMYTLNEIQELLEILGLEILEGRDDFYLNSNFTVIAKKN